MHFMFLGEYFLSFTGHGRVLLPKKIREELSSVEVVVSRGLDGCIFGFDLKNWEEQSQKQLEIPLLTEEGRQLRRYFFSSAVKLDIDKQGRIVLPKELMEYAKINGTVALIGAGDHFEIWDEVAWHKVTKDWTK
jgi:MraZ protein